jgi:hypothetical protein
MHIKYKIQSAISAVRRFFFPAHPRFQKVYPRHEWRDIVELSIDANFAMILDFYYEEYMRGTVDWDATLGHKNFRDELLVFVDYIERERPRMQKEYTDTLDEFAIDFNWLETKEKTKEIGKKLDVLEKEIFDSDTKWVKWFIENRNFFWT